ncbi:MAG: hypothetical protein M1814_005505 [Vezdaea aestivalis]|nr:MAG: hypothetical protein M1814_005505 [Vezdaea aestivalis]
MADFATPSAASIATGSVVPEKTVAPGHKVKPEKPDEELYKAELAKAEKDHAAAQEKLNAIKAKMALATPRDSDSPTAKRQQELRSKLSAIRAEQQGLKSSKGNVQEKIRGLEASLKTRITESKASRSRVPFKSVEEVDREIQRLEKQVDTGTMKIVDEKRTLNDISNLRKQRKTFSGFDETQKGIDEIKSQITALKKGMDDPHAKALSEDYTKIAAELDEIKKSQDEAYKGLSSLRDEKTKLQADQNASWAALRAVKDKYYEQKKAAAEWEREAYKARKEKQKVERDQWEKEKRRKVADSKLEDASQPAYYDEILATEGLLRYFDPTFKGNSSASTGPGKFAAQATRKIEEGDQKGTRLLKKDDDENYFMGTGGKKGRKGKKSATSSPSLGGPAESTKFNLSIGIIEEFGKISLDAPMGQSDVPATVEKLNEKLKFWKDDQDRKTKENIAKAKKEIDRLNAAEANGSTNKEHRSKDTAKKPAVAGAVDPSGETELRLEKESAEDAAEELDEAKIEDETTL